MKCNVKKLAATVTGELPYFKPYVEVTAIKVPMGTSLYIPMELSQTPRITGKLGTTNNNVRCDFNFYNPTRKLRSGMQLWSSNGSAGVIDGYLGDGSTSDLPAPAVNTLFEYEIYSGHCLVNGTDIAGNNFDMDFSDGNLEQVCISSGNSRTQVQGADFWFGRYTLYENASAVEPLIDIIPVKMKEDDSLKLYDLVSDTYYDVNATVYQ